MIKFVLERTQTKHVLISFKRIETQKKVNKARNESNTLVKNLHFVYLKRNELMASHFKIFWFSKWFSVCDTRVGAKNVKCESYLDGS